MTADGDYLSGSFARTSNGQARELVNSGWQRFEQLARQRGWSPQPIPTNRFELTMGKPTQPGGIKLAVTSRDLPRGNDRRPGTAEWERAAYNLNWIDFTPNEARTLLTDRRDRVAVPRSLLQRLTQETIRDNVRGQCSWKKGAFREGELFTQLIQSNGAVKTVRLSGYAIVSEGGRVIGAELHGQADFNSNSGEFTRFDLIASGQRQGAAAANARQHDPGPAPIGFAYSLHRSRFNNMTASR